MISIISSTLCSFWSFGTDRSFRFYHPYEPQFLQLLWPLLGPTRIRPSSAVVLPVFPAVAVWPKSPTAECPFTDWGCCTVTDVLFRKVLQFLEPFRPYRRVPIPDDAPLVQGRLTRGSVIVDRVPSSFNLYVRGALSFDPVRPCEMFRRIVGYHTMPVDCTELSQIVQLCRPIFGLIRSEFILPSLLDCRPTFSVLFFFFSS